MNQGRNIQKLNLDWKFFRGDEPKAWYKGLDDSGWQNVTLGHDWSVTEPFSREHSSGTGYLPGGIGWYRRTFHLPAEAKGKKVSVTFEGIYNNSQVWCNSFYIGKRPYGYSSFTYDITYFAAFGDVENVICVKVNHKDIADSRWFTGSGIYRNVVLAVMDPVHFDNNGVFITTPEVSREQATVVINTRMSNETETAVDVDIKTSILDEKGNVIAVTQVTIALQSRAGTEAEAEAWQGERATAGAVVKQRLQVPDPRLWSPDTPYLYTVLTEIVKNGKVIDQVYTPVGIRWFSFDADKGFFLNDVNMKIKGVCVHHDAGCLGAAVPEKVWIRRLESLKEMGCNAIRMSHNPPAPGLLDLCDRMGFLVMDEAFDEWEGVKNKWSTGHNVYPPKHFGYYEDFPQWGETDIKGMVLRDRNHPSIILWSIGNEVDYPNDPYCHPSFQTMTGNNDANKPAAEREYDPDKPNAERLAVIARRLVRYVKECDTTRPVTAAVAFPELSNLTGYSAALDVVGYNYKEHLYEEDHRKYPDRVTYGSENGSSMEAWNAVRNNDYICAQFIWTGIDYLGEAQGWPVRAAQSGFLNLAGYKKTGYFYRKSLWNSEPMAYLAARKKCEEAPDEGRRRNIGEPHWNWRTGEKIEVICYTNCEEAELFINGKPAGSKRLEDFPQQYLVWEVDFEEGTLCVSAKNRDGRTSACELVTVTGAQKLAMHADASVLLADGQDMAHLDIQIQDDSGRLVYMANDMIKISLEGPGEILGIENGDVCDLEPYSSRKRKACNGKLLAYVRAKTAVGRIIIRADASGLEPAAVTIDTY
jgi:beta-galactosidase